VAGIEPGASLKRSCYSNMFAVSLNRMKLKVSAVIIRNPYSSIRIIPSSLKRKLITKLSSGDEST
jgi:hypothetical protein